jgi:heme-degrading monooxygenase HmoA
MCESLPNHQRRNQPSPPFGLIVGRFLGGPDQTPIQHLERRTLMFTRIVECTVRPDKKDEIQQRLRNEVLPLLQKQPGFVDEITLASEQDPERMVAISFWKTREDAERYHRETFPKVQDILKTSLKSSPKVETYNVQDSTAHRIAAGRAAA